MSSTQKPRQDNQHNKRKNSILKFALLALIGIGATSFAAQQAMSAKLSAHLDNPGLKPKPVTGTVLKTLEQFSFSSNTGQQYHIDDPSNIIDSIAKQRGIKDSFYKLDNVCIKGVVSKVGSYGHMGYFERQIIVTGKC